MNVRPRSRITALASVVALGLATLGLAGPVRAQDSEFEPGDLELSGLSALLVGGEYSWEFNVDQPAPATMYGVPAELFPIVGARTVIVTYDWGDNSPVTTFASDGDFSQAQFSMWCNSDYGIDENSNYFPKDGFGYGCRAGATHRYASQGIYTVTATARQQTQDGYATGTTTRTDVVVDTSLAASLSGRGTVYAPQGSGGMYDQDFPGGEVTFSVTARRAARSAGTKASVTVSVPSMAPDYPPSDPPTGMTFVGSAAMAPLFVAKTRTGGEAYLSRVEGTVTNSHGYAGGAWAIVHVKMQKGSPTLVRVMVHNTSAGYTYVDTGWNQTDTFNLDADHDLLTGGSVKIG